MAWEHHHLAEVKRRLVASELTPEDVEFLEELIDIHEKPSDEQEVDGRPVVARLPLGIDVLGPSAGGS